jgi:hypothetical protein
MEGKERNPLEVPEHNWLFDTHAGFYYCEHCRLEVSKYLYELEKDDNPECGQTLLLDHIVDAECE